MFRDLFGFGYQIEDQNMQKLANGSFAGFFVYGGDHNVQEFANF